MKDWQRRILGVLALGGSFLGLALGISLAFAPGTSVLARLFCLPFIGLYCWGVWCGLRMIEEPDAALRSNRIFWALQIPYFMSPIAGYFFASGSLIFVTFRPHDLNFGALWRLGSQFEYSLLQLDKPLTIGINLFALAVVVFLTVQLRKEPTSSSFEQEPLSSGPA
jgi:hypothetical protein